METLTEAFDLLPWGAALFDAERRLVHANPPFLGLRGYPQAVCRPGVSLDELLAFNAARGDFGPGEPADQVAERIAEIEQATDREIEREMADGQILGIRYRRTPAGGLLVTMQDRTEERRAQAALSASEERHALVTRATSDGLYDWNVTDDRLYVSDALRGILGFDPGLRGSVAWVDRVHPDDAGRYLDAIRAHFRGDADAIECEYRIRGADDSWLTVHDRGVGVRGPDGRVKRLVGAIRDVSNLRRAERDAETARRRLEEALESLSTGFVLWDADDRLVTCNTRYRDYFARLADMVAPGVVFDDVIRTAVERGMFPQGEDDPEGFVAQVVARRCEGSGEQREQHLDGDVWLLVTDHRTADGGLVSIYTEITGLKRAERRVREREAALGAKVAELDAVMENIAYGVVFMGPDLRVRFANRAFRDMWSVPQSFLDGAPHMRELIGWNRNTGVYCVPEEAFDAWVEDRVVAIAAGDIPPREFARADGRTVTYAGVVLPDGGRMLTYFEITELKRKEAELREARDAAEAALADLREAQARLIQAEKMASLGQLTAGIAHEIKNPLNFVNNFASLSGEMLGELEEILAAPLARLDEDERDDAADLFQTVRGNLAKIEEHGRRADSIVRNMLMHSREGSGELQAIDLNDAAREALALAYHGARAADPDFNIEMEEALAPDLGAVQGRPQDLQRVFLNLCANAMYAAGRRSADDGAVPLVVLRTTVIDGAAAVQVEDNGDGVPGDIRETIFQPFFTTKPTGEGTGLGLSMSYDIVRQHGGDIVLADRPGGGSVFRVSLPVAKGGKA